MSQCKDMGWSYGNMIVYVVCYFSRGAVYQSPYELTEAEAESVLATLNSMDSLEVMKEGAEDSLYG